MCGSANSRSRLLARRFGSCVYEQRREGQLRVAVCGRERWSAAEVLVRRCVCGWEGKERRSMLAQRPERGQIFWTDLAPPRAFVKAPTTQCAEMPSSTATAGPPRGSNPGASRKAAQLSESLKLKCCCHSDFATSCASALRDVEEFKREQVPRRRLDIMARRRHLAAPRDPLAPVGAASARVDSTASCVVASQVRLKCCESKAIASHPVL